MGHDGGPVSSRVSILVSEGLARFNNPKQPAAERLKALEEFVSEKKSAFSPLTGEVNNHIHTVYSFSPYTPTAAAFMARMAGLGAAGCIDHDSIAGVREMSAACGILNIGSTAGYEIRVNFSDTPFRGRKLNNPDSDNIAYITVHGLASSRIDDAAAFLAPIQARRNVRNRKMTGKMNMILGETGFPPVDFEKEVAGFSMAPEGGSITERHIIAAASRRFIGRFGRGPELPAFLRETLAVPVSPKAREYLSDPDNPHYFYDLLGVLKSTFLEQFFIQPDEEECIPVGAALEFARSIDAVPAYAYLGDVTESPTGDKKSEKFEDSYIDDLVPGLKLLGFRGVTYMPPRNTLPQLMKIRELCRAGGLMEISGVDINSSRQVFSCPEVLRKPFIHLIDATWALIAHERLTADDPAQSLFSPDNPLAEKPLEGRILEYNKIGRKFHEL